MDKVTSVTEWDVRNGGVYRNGQAIASYSGYRLANPDGMTVEQWEASAWRKVELLAYGKVAVERTWLAVFSDPR